MTKGEIGFVGLGRMGFPMARNLAGAGYRVHAHDVAAEALARAGAVNGVVTHASAREVAGASAVVFTALPNDAVVRETYLGPAGLLAGGRAGLVTCDCSTVSPGLTLEVHRAATGRGIHHLDTPMLGSTPQAESGEIFFMVGGDEAQMAVIRPLLDVMGRLTMHVGPPGTGNRIKLLHNALGAVNAVAVAESLALCDAVGVDPRTYYAVVKNGGGMAYSTYFDRRVTRVVEGSYEPTFTLELMLKDVALATEMAGDLLGKLPVLRETLAAYVEGQRRGSGAEDFSAVTHVLEDRLGRRLFSNAGVRP
ncbi:MAG TPA: NAD(P)-dependent oxidoreductase [Methylomirabilota bacterium]|jgi:3-hydroxyisobutyrate dehydrogenase-like beta-hydroxyacid dehydrogenase